MKNPKVSVIVPVYNAGKFLEKNLLCLCRQTLAEIEFILINDASNDNSLDIMTAFKMAFPNKFTVIDSKKNRGPGGARNLGLSYANGEYIGFFDCDDTIKETMFEMLYNEAEKGRYDIVSCGFYNERWAQYRYPAEIKGQLDDEKRYKYLNHTYYTVNKIFKASIIREMEFAFRENVTGEDTDFMLEALARAETVSYVPKCLYTYVYNQNSETKRKIYDIENEYSKYAQLFESIEKRCKPTKHYNVIQQISNEIIRIYLNSLIMLEVFKDDFSFSDVKKFHNFAVKYNPEYYKFKYKDIKDVEKMVYNALDKDIKKSYENLFKVKKMVNLGN